MSNSETENKGSEQALMPVEQESIVFHEQDIVAVRLADGRICVVLRWICESLKLAPNPQVRRIERTAATANELVRVKVQTRGGRQTMPAITLRGFTPWVLGLNLNEIQDEENPQEAERIRSLIIAYQTEAKDVLYEHFVNKRRLTLPDGTFIPVAPAQPQEPEVEATDAEKATYYENLAVWALWKARQHAQRWRGGIEEWRGEIESRLEGQEAMSGLLPEILERLGPEKLTPEHQQRIQYYVGKLHEATGKHQATIHAELKTAFKVPRYQEILEDDWPGVENWFRVQIERAQGKPGR
ncbi:MAG TPA: phage antirepressor N-terminal domain-containing protein [Ktedonobacteraceae bacterium]|nr:phage antirepressor N-terminal domain-containing protein [Ktedonobacteraceae bacterium]